MTGRMVKLGVDLAYTICDTWSLKQPELMLFGHNFFELDTLADLC